MGYGRYIWPFIFCSAWNVINPTTISNNIQCRWQCNKYSKPRYLYFSVSRGGCHKSSSSSAHLDERRSHLPSVETCYFSHGVCLYLRKANGDAYELLCRSDGDGEKRVSFILLMRFFTLWPFSKINLLLKRKHRSENT